MFVGVGASRVRDLFEQAKQNSPVHHLRRRDRRRRPPPRRRHGRRARRARADAEPAARRDGRLRRHAAASSSSPRPTGPTSSTRRCCAPAASTARSRSRRPTSPVGAPILQVHAKGKPMAGDADLDGLAKRTVGFSGADLANVLNEAALLTARINAADHRGRPRGVGRPRDRRPGPQEPDHLRAGEEGHRLPRGGARARRVGDAGHRAGLQGDDPAARPHRRARPRRPRGRQGAR